jgi:toxin coregulated pilus biosynthesis protein E
MAMSDIEVEFSSEVILEKLHIDPKALLKARFNLKARKNLYKKMGSFLRANFPVKDTLEKLAMRYHKTKDYRGKIIDYWLDDIHLGKEFQECIRPWVPTQEHMLIAAAQRSGNIIAGLFDAVDLSEKSQLITKVIRSALLYPIFLLLMCGGLFEMFYQTIAPAYTTILPVDQWPEGGQRLYHVSEFIHNFKIFVGIAIVIGSIAISKTMPIWTGNIRNIFDRLPPWNIYKIKQSTSFLVSLSALLKAAVPFYDSLETIYNLSSPYVRQYVEKMMINIKVYAIPPRIAINVGLIPLETAGNIEDFGELGEVEQAIYDLAKEDLQDSIERITFMSTVIRTIGMFIVMFLIGWVYMTSNDINGALAASASKLH